MNHCYRCGLIQGDIKIFIVAPKTVEYLCVDCAKTLKEKENGNLSDSNRVSTPVAKGSSGNKTLG